VVVIGCIAARESLLNFAAKFAIPIKAPPVICEVSVYLKSAKAGVAIKGSTSEIDSDLRTRFMSWLSMFGLDVLVSVGTARARAGSGAKDYLARSARGQGLCQPRR